MSCRLHTPPGQTACSMQSFQYEALSNIIAWPLQQPMLDMRCCEGYSITHCQAVELDADICDPAPSPMQAAEGCDTCGTELGSESLSRLLHQQDGAEGNMTRSCEVRQVVSGMPVAQNSQSAMSHDLLMPEGLNAATSAAGFLGILHYMMQLVADLCTGVCSLSGPACAVHLCCSCQDRLGMTAQASKQRHVWPMWYREFSVALTKKEKAAAVAAVASSVPLTAASTC